MNTLEKEFVPYQESLEEAAERLTENAYQNDIWEEGRLKRHGYYHGVVDGAKWQQERMYSEEETYRILHKLMMEIHIDGLLIADDTDLKMWFQQNKKKQ